MLGEATMLAADTRKRGRVWSGRFPPTRTTDVARLYLGLTLAREGDRQRGVKEIESGMRGIHDWLDYVNRQFAFSWGKYWDPT